jgi:glycosyltransferase involved in cell wall biosynthesis
LPAGSRGLTLGAMNPLRDEHHPRLLLCSYHCYLDPSSGAALSTRDLLELLAGRSWPCGVFCGPLLDFEQPRPLEPLLREQQIPLEVVRGQLGAADFSLFNCVPGGVPVTVFEPAAARPSQSPGRAEGGAFLRLFDAIVERFRPDLLLTYGGSWLAPPLMAAARRRGLAVVFSLRNLAYHGASLFRDADAVLVPSRFAAEHYRRALGLSCTAIPGPWRWERLRCPQVEGRYVTFVNPQPHKGVFWFARLAQELGRLRPDIPLLVVEGRAGVDWLARTGVDLSGLTNLHRMANTPDPRDFYGVSRVVLMPSLVPEAFPRVAVEACLNGIPVVGSRRGGLPEALHEAGFVFDIPARYTPQSRLVPTAEEVAPWVETVIRLWDDAAFYERERRRCLAAAEAWRPERLLPLLEAFLAGVLAARGQGGPNRAPGQRSEGP